MTRFRLLCVALLLSAAVQARASWVSSALDIARVIASNSDHLVDVYEGIANAVNTRDPVKGKQLLAKLEGRGRSNIFGLDFSDIFEGVKSILPVLTSFLAEEAPLGDGSQHRKVTATGAFTSIPVGAAPSTGYYPGIYPAVADILAVNNVPLFVNSTPAAPIMIQSPHKPPRVYQGNGGEIIDVVEKVAEAITASIFGGSDAWPADITRSGPFNITVLDGSEGEGKLLLSVYHDFHVAAPLASNKTASCLSGLTLNISTDFQARPHFVPMQSWNHLEPAAAGGSRSRRSLLDKDAARGQSMGGSNGQWTSVLNVVFQTTTYLEEIVNAMVEGLKTDLEVGTVSAITAGTTTTFTVKTAKAAANVKQLLFDRGVPAAQKYGNAVVDIVIVNSDWALR